jgi:hypothetical protein
MTTFCWPGGSLRRTLDHMHRNNHRMRQYQASGVGCGIQRVETIVDSVQT